MDKRLRLSPKGAIRFLAVLLMIVWMWNFFRSYFLLLLILLMITGAVLSTACLWAARGRVRAKIETPYHRVGKNTDIPVDIRFDNSMRFAGFAIDVTYRRGNLFTGSTEEESGKLWAAPGKGGRLKFLLNSRYAGQVRVSVERFRVYDLLHIFYLAGQEAKDAEALVWPVISDREEAEEPAACIEGFPREDENRKRGAEYRPDYEIREYIAGDELKNIHWKLSAKQGKMMVRERLAAGKEKINVALPLSDDPDWNDALMEALCAIGRALLSREYPIRLFWLSSNHALCSRYIAEAGEFETALGELLSTTGIRSFGSIEEQMVIEHPSERYILVRTGTYKGVYV